MVPTYDEKKSMHNTVNRMKRWNPGNEVIHKDSIKEKMEFFGEMVETERHRSGIVIKTIENKHKEDVALLVLEDGNEVIWCIRDIIGRG